MSVIKEETLAPQLGEWWKYFRPFWEDDGFDPIYQKLQKDTNRGIVICPDYENTFRSFRTIIPGEIRVVWVLLDPYPSVYNGVKSADGVAMSCENRKVNQPSLDKFYDGIIDYVGNKKMDKPYSLKYLIDQGNMFFNTALTVPKDKTGAHLKLWEPFMKFFYEEVMINFSGIIYVLCGDESHKMKRWINPLGNYIFELEHPSFAARQDRDWKTQDIFKKINFLLKGNNGPEAQIIWDYNKYLTTKHVSELTDAQVSDLVDDLPF